MPSICCMQTLGFFHSNQRVDLGFTWVELLLVLAVIGAIGLMATPSLQGMLERARVELARDQLLNDLHSARVRALQQGQALRLTRLGDCAWASTAGSDWSCGWQLQLADGSQTLQVTAMHAPLQVSYTKTTALAISRQGELGGVGDRWTVSSRNSRLTLAYALCLNNTGRLRVVAGSTCS
ncbi:Tfp pilus assembly protein FimT/FimU [Limnohabitans sp.]|uniref:pilus assembly FimT family protein n=1 Tax=Limnohabitans sp. TaxID=1907725 RepID=UPI0038BB85A1